MRFEARGEEDPGANVPNARLVNKALYAVTVHHFYIPPYCPTVT